MKRLRLIAIVGVVLLLGWVVFRPAGSKEPSYQGRRLSTWMNDYDDTSGNPQKFSDPAATRNAAVHAIKEIGTNAIPTLLLWAQATNSSMTLKLNALLERQPYIRFRFKRAEDWKLHAVSGVDILGNDAMPALPGLTQLLKSPDLQQRWVALQCLMLIDDGKKDLSPIFVQSLQDPARGIRKYAAIVLDKYHPQEAEKAGVYKMFPRMKHSTTNTAPTNSLPAQ